MKNLIILYIGKTYVLIVKSNFTYKCFWGNPAAINFDLEECCDPS